MNWMQYANKGAQRVAKFQQGGVPAEAGMEGQPMPEEGGAPAEGGGGDVMSMIQQAVETQDPAMAQQAVQMISQDPNACLELLMAVAGGGAQGGAPAEGGAPMARNGMQMNSTIGGPVFNI